MSVLLSFMLVLSLYLFIGLIVVALASFYDTRKVFDTDDKHFVKFMFKRADYCGTGWGGDWNPYITGVLLWPVVLTTAFTVATVLLLYCFITSVTRAFQRVLCKR